MVTVLHLENTRIPFHKKTPGVLYSIVAFFPSVPQPGWTNPRKILLQSRPSNDGTEGTLHLICTYRYLGPDPQVFFLSQHSLGILTQMVD